MIQYPSIRQDHIPDSAAIFVAAEFTDDDGFSENQVGREVLGAVAERLGFLRRVNAVQPDTFAHAVVEDSDSIAV
jgi:hypothetical protein